MLAQQAIKHRLMNIRYGNGAAIVVRERESRLHGEGGQFERIKIKID